MFSYFKSLFSEPSEDDSDKSFSQKEVLDQHDQTEGLCSPLSNIIAKDHILGRDSKILNDQEKYYSEAVKEENHQLKLLEANKDGHHSAFVDLEVSYSVKNISKKELIDPKGLEELLPEAGNALITYPVSKGDKHMIYLGRDDNGKCYNFDANRYTQELKAPCKSIFSYTSNQLREKATEDSEVKVAIARGDSQRRFT